MREKGLEGVLLANMLVPLILMRMALPVQLNGTDLELLRSYAVPIQG